MDASRTDRMVQLTNHYIGFGHPTHVALEKAERKMIEDGELVDHEAVAAEKLAAEKRRQREVLELEKQLVAVQLEESKREKRKRRQREMADAEEERRTVTNSIDGSVLNRTGSHGYVGHDGTFHTKAGSHGVINSKTGDFSPVH